MLTAATRTLCCNRDSANSAELYFSVTGQTRSGFETHLSSKSPYQIITLLTDDFAELILIKRTNQNLQAAPLIVPASVNVNREFKVRARGVRSPRHKLQNKNLNFAPSANITSVIVVGVLNL